jgi:FKBP-type peptidyl-prolyl cis-trans isomerase (trigger factor)
MKLLKSKLKQLIKEELKKALQESHGFPYPWERTKQKEEENRVAAILSEFTPEEIDLLRKDLESRVPNQFGPSLEDVVEMYLDHPEMGEDKLIKIMRSIIAHGSSDAMFAAEKEEKEEWRRQELKRQADRRASGVSPSDIRGRTPPWEQPGNN